jgi:CheY-specific phosphatase CheX
MNNSAEKILYRKAALIFEELGFLMPRPEGSGVSCDERTSAMVLFNGPFSGYLLVSLSTEILSRLSSNMLGAEETSNEVLQQDSLKEISNVICGNALPAIYGFEPIFHLDAPVICEGNGSTMTGTAFDQAAQVHLSFDIGNAEITLFVETGALQAAVQ